MLDEKRKAKYHEGYANERLAYGFASDITEEIERHAEEDQRNSKIAYWHRVAEESYYPCSYRRAHICAHDKRYGLRYGQHACADEADSHHDCCRRRLYEHGDPITKPEACDTMLRQCAQRRSYLCSEQFEDALTHHSHSVDAERESSKQGQNI